MADEELMKSLYKSFNTCGKVSFSIKLQAYNQLKTDSGTGGFPVKLAKFLRTLFYKTPSVVSTFLWVDTCSKSTMTWTSINADGSQILQNTYIHAVIP